MAGIRRVSFDGTNLMTYGLVFNVDGNGPLSTAYGALTHGFIYGYGEVWFNEDNITIQQVTWDDCDCQEMCA